MSSNFPIDIETAKSTKLFKKFMESKNKSTVVTGPKIENIEFSPNMKQNEDFYSYDSQNKKKELQQQVHTEQLKDMSENNNFNENFRSTEKNRSLYVEADTFMQRNTEIQRSKRKNSPSIHEHNEETIQKEFRTGLITDQYNNEILNKYNRLFEEHNELKDRIISERKESKKQMIKMQEEMDILNKKVFELRNKEDELILENKRIKEKAILEAKTKKELEESNRELSYQVQEMKDMANGQENSSKKHEDDTLHWKKFNEELKEKIRELESEIVKFKDQNNVLEREKLIAWKEASNKEAHLNEMRDKINELITDNSLLKDEIFHITSKLYNFEQENKVLKADVRRNSEQFPLSYLQEHLKEVPRGHTRSQYIAHENFEEKGIERERNLEKPERAERRRGEFARERGMKKVDNQVQNKPVNKETETSVNQSTPNNQVAISMKKHEELCQELQKIKDSKAVNGAMRRQKITIERELQEIEEFLKSKQNQQ